MSRYLPHQDMPPSGGFPSIAIQRHLPKKGFGSLATLIGVSAITIGGLAQYIRKQKIEKSDESTQTERARSGGTSRVLSQSLTLANSASFVFSVVVVCSSPQ